jgi:hypothetical protein
MFGARLSGFEYFSYYLLLEADFRQQLNGDLFEFSRISRLLRMAYRIDLERTTIAGADRIGQTFQEAGRVATFSYSVSCAAFARSLISSHYESISNRAPRTSWATYSRWPLMLLPFLSAYHQFLPLNFGFISTTYLNLGGTPQWKVTL